GRRAATALLTLSLAGTGVRSSVLRFPPTVHGDGDHGFMTTLVGVARSGAWPVTWVTAATAGRPCTAPTPPAFPALPSRRLLPARSCTPWPTRASLSGISPRRLPDTSASPRLQ